MGKVSDKRDMYRQLARGDFGNTVPQWFDLAAWEKDPAALSWKVWGIRSSTTAAHPGMRLHVPTKEVARHIREHFGSGGVNISPMVDAVATVTLMADVFDSPTGLVVEGCEFPGPGASWRQVMRDRRSRWEGIAARHLLARHLNPNSLDDLFEIFAIYPEHVVELSALDRCLGTVSHRNAVIWEVRCSDGTYETWGKR